MGVLFTDQYSLLHFAVGIVVYYWDVSFITWFIVHLLYEYVENTEYGMRWINQFSRWPGGKEYADSMVNRLGDQFYAMLGWYVAYLVCA
jgi:hypothetical protein